MAIILKQELPIGEDRVSIQRHIDDLKTLAGQRNPDQALIRDKLRRTFSHRKMQITTESVNQILDTYPVLRHAAQVNDPGSKIHKSAQYCFKTFSLL